MTALIISFLLGPFLIQSLKRFQSIGQPIRDDGPTSHLIKKGTPTMGGLLIYLLFYVNNFMVQIRQYSCMDYLNNIYIFGLIGLYDDWLKVRKKSTKGLRGKYKLILQILISLIAVYLINQQF